jgi:hypothetical protein
MDATSRDRLLTLAMWEIKEAFERYAAQVFAADLLKCEHDGSLAFDAWIASLAKVAERLGSMPDSPATRSEKESIEEVVRRVGELEWLYRLGEMGDDKDH